MNNISQYKEETLLLAHLSKNSSSENHLLTEVVTLGIKAKQQVNNYDHPDQTIQECYSKFLKAEKGLDNGIWKGIPLFRIVYKEAETKIISEICKKYLSVNNKIVEIGAGALANDLSYLMQRMPVNLRASVEPTELNQFFVKNTRLKRVDLCAMEESYPLSSIDKIIGSSVLDTLSVKDLDISCKKMHSVLKPGGLLIHFAHLMPYQDTLLTSYREDSSVCFPWEDDDGFNGLLRIEKKALHNFIQKNTKNSDLARKFFIWYSKLSASVRELTLNAIMESEENSISLCNWVKSFNINGLEKIDNLVAFEERMKKAFKSAQFEILNFGFRTGSHVRDRTSFDSKDFNYFSYEFGKKKASTLYVLLPNKVCHAFKMHVIVAKKKDDK